MNIKRVQLKVLLLLIIVLISNYAIGQNLSGSDRSKISKAEKLFDADRFKEALAVYDSYLQQYPDDAELNYLKGKCLLSMSSNSDRVKSLDFLKKCVGGVEAGNVPFDSYFYLGRAYQYNSKFKMALKAFDTYKTMPATAYTARNLNYITLWAQQCEAGLAVTGKEMPYVVMNVGAPINSEYPEYGAGLTADNQTMVFNTLRPANQVIDGEKSEVSKEFIMFSQKSGDLWDTPNRVHVNEPNACAVTYITPDGQSLIVYYDVGNGNTDLYFLPLNNGKGGSLNAIQSSKLNGKYKETSASMLPDGSKMFFSSDRYGGYGGLDIYVSEKVNGAWGLPQNVGNAVNSKYDEDSPFIHPNGQMLFFQRNGVTSMGGTDIFKASLRNNQWADVENMGFPVNSPFDDGFFVMSPDGKKAYLSSNRPGGNGEMDIYFVGIPEEENIISLTMVKGVIKTTSGEKLEDVKIRVREHESGKMVRDVYNPDPITGRYLMIFPPNQNYDMIIEAKGYQPYQVNINVPGQTYFYELYQQITLKPIRQFDELVGQEISVKNAFHDVFKGERQNKVKVDPRKIKEARLIRDSVDIFTLMEGVVAGSDTVAYEYLLDLIFNVNPNEEVDFEAETEAQIAEVSFYYEENPGLVPVELDGDTIYTLPTVDMTKEEKILEKTVFGNDDNFKIIEETTVYFDKSSHKIDKGFKESLADMVNLLLSDNGLGVEIKGYSSESGDKDFNQELSNKRAREVLNFFNKNGIGRRRILAQGLGQISGNKVSEDKARKVEIKIFTLGNE